MRGKPSNIPPWLPEHLCKHCGVQSKAGAAGLAHTCNMGEIRVCQEPAQYRRAPQSQNTRKGMSINESQSVHKGLRDLLAESTIILSVSSPQGAEGHSLNSQGPRNHSPTPSFIKGKSPLSKSHNARPLGSFPEFGPLLFPLPQEDHIKSTDCPTGH